MKEICRYESCTGCMACVNACAHKAISMQPDEEGFLRPVVQEETCVDCGLCIKVCPVNNTVELYRPIKAFSGWSNNNAIRLSSSSGGAFTEIAKLILKSNGVVFGCVLNEKLQAEHTYVDTIEGLEKLKGSKYVQSFIGNCYEDARHFLKSGRNVLFTGTPCQIAGLRNYLRNDYENLFTIDLVCHGVPSPLIFEEYKRYIAKQQKFKTITDIKFRCKKSSWIFFNMTIKGHVEKNDEICEYNGRYYHDPYIRGFLRDYFLRPNCHKCLFSTIYRTADFTIADWWTYNDQEPKDKDFDKKGVSLVLCNTTRAVKLAKHLDMDLTERTIDEASRTSPPLRESFPAPALRQQFWIDYKTLSFDLIVSKYMYPGEWVLLSKYIKYHIGKGLLYSIVFLYERICRKFRMRFLLVKVRT